MLRDSRRARLNGCDGSSSTSTSCSKPGEASHPRWRIEQARPQRVGLWVWLSVAKLPELAAHDLASLAK